MSSFSFGFWSGIDSLCVVLQKGDVLKIDIGIQVGGRICDSAFTLNFEPTYDKLIEAVKAATDTGVRVSRSDMPWIQKFLEISGSWY